MNIRTCMVLKSTSAELPRSNFVRQSLTLEVCLDEPKLVDGGQSRKAGSRLRVGIYIPSLDMKRFYRE
jgi:hypothetical protein